MGIIEVISNHSRLMFDTAPIIYFIEENKDFSKLAEEIINYGTNKLFLFSSVITLTEVLTKPIRNDRQDLVEKYTQLLLDSDDFTIYPIDAIIAEKSAELRAKYNFRTPDAIQLAVAIENNATLFITNDKDLERIKEIEVLVLKDYL